MADDRERLRTTFDSAADLYHQARPDYPQPLYDALIHDAGLAPGDQLLEIGCATGKATLPLARRWFRLTCLEIGSALAASAEIEHTGLFTDVTVRHFDWEISYTAAQYLRLLDTFSGHIAMNSTHRDRLYSEITRRLARRPDGRLTRGLGRRSARRAAHMTDTDR